MIPHGPAKLPEFALGVGETFYAESLRDRSAGNCRTSG